MQSTDFVYQQIYKGSLSQGAKEKAAHDAAVMGLGDYKKGKFKKAQDLIKQYIQKAKKQK